jgi:hypothetical protein
MNKRLLLRVKKHILEEPARLHMADWIRRRRTDASSGRALTHDYPSCGTAACIGGWAIILSKKRPSVDIFGQAARILGLETDAAQDLFVVSHWPTKFLAGASDDGKQKTAEIVAKRIDHFIQFGR